MYNKIKLAWNNSPSTLLTIIYKSINSNSYVYKISYKDNNNFSVEINISPHQLIRAINLSIPLYISRNSNLSMGEKITIIGNNNNSIYLADFMHSSGFKPQLFLFNQKVQSQYDFPVFYLDNLSQKNKEKIEKSINDNHLQSSHHVFDLTSNSNTLNFIFEFCKDFSNINFLYDDVKQFSINTYSDIHVLGTKFRALNIQDLFLNILREYNISPDFSIFERSLKYVGKKNRRKSFPFWKKID